MTTAHYTESPAAVATFERLKANPAHAVRAILAAGFSLNKEDIDADHIVELARLDRGSRSDYARRYAGELANERTALTLIENQVRVRASLVAGPLKYDAHAADIRARAVAGQLSPGALDAARDTWVLGRAAELRAAHEAELMARFREQAEREAMQKFAPTAPAPAPFPAAEPAATAKKRRAA